MKTIIKNVVLILLLLFCFCACSGKYTFTEEETGALTRSDGKVFYPIANSYRYSDLGLDGKSGAILGADVYSVKGSDNIVFSDETYYVIEEYKGLDVTFENCKEFLYAPRADLDDNGRVSEKYLKKAEKLIGEDAVDFAFYIFYGREPKELGFEQGVYQGEVIALFDIDEPFVSSYPVYQWSDKVYSVEIDGTHYTLEDKWAKKIGIID
ncbi:MAG: hypothetical protein IJ323_00440 [Clostridia bacterium]|nr:hypothetical protein [Clostridia bacterium]